MSKSFFVDTTICTACRGCQVACKQWHDLPAEETTNRGTYENPADLSFITYKVVRMREQVIDGKLNWLFFPEQCRHCIEAPCLEIAGDPGAIFKDDKTGAIIFTANTKRLNAAEIIEACPYNIPRKAPDGTLAKCDMCLDRVENGLVPACVQTCPTGAMNFGDRDEMLALAKKRLGEVKKANPKAMLIDEDTVSVIYLVAYEPKLYCKNAVASNADFSITRHMALKRMIRPLTNLTSRLL
ncbi:MAG: 4Fe-4S dicluster domain-containing protein [Thermodesulfovibrionales bacterium]|nr:4Fe-4S dicluster domain-containing protein [Thermodesulfovibrionales bacterium]